MKNITTYNTDLNTAEQGFAITLLRYYAITLLRWNSSCRAYCKQLLHYLYTVTTCEIDEKPANKYKGISRGTKKAINEIIQGIES